MLTDSGYTVVTTTYTVVNQTSGDTAVYRSPFVSGGDMFPIFDGIGVKIYNDAIAYLPAESGLSNGQSNYQLDVMPDTISGLKGLYPADYEIRFTSGISDTSRGSEIGLTEIPVNFTVHNLTEDLPADFLFYDNDGDQQVSSGDELVPLIPDDFAPNGVGYYTTWRIRFLASGGNNVPPQPDDVFTVRVSKPFRGDDVFTFKTLQPARVDVNKAKSDLDRIKVVPNPYIVTNPLEPRNLLTSGRGDRVIYFTHLPAKCTIRIFTLRGQLVDVIEHDSPLDDGFAKWDLTSREGIDVAFGVYIYHVQSELGNKIGRFAIIK